MKKLAISFIVVFLAALFFTGTTKAQVNQNDVIINEFLPNPVSADGKEYVELLVVSANPVNLAGFRLSDVSTKGGAGGTTEGHLDFPNAAYLNGLTRGTRIVCVMETPAANSNHYAIEDTDPSDSTLVLFSSHLSGGSLTATNVLDLALAENICLLDGPNSSSNTIDAIFMGANASQPGFPDAIFNTNITASASGLVTYFTNDRIGGMNNDTGNVGWLANQPSADKTPGQKNKNQIFAFISAVSGDGAATLLNVTTSDITLKNTTIFHREVGGQTVQISVKGKAGSFIDTVIVEVPVSWGSFDAQGVALGGAFTGKTAIVSGRRITIADAHLTATAGTVDIPELTTPNPSGVGVEGNYSWSVYTGVAPDPVQLIGTLPSARVIIPVQNIRSGGADGFGNSDLAGNVPVMLNKVVAIEGVVTVEDSVLESNITTSFFIQDGDYGLQVFKSNTNSTSLYQRGSKVIVLGNITAFNGNTEIQPSTMATPDFFVEGSDVVPSPMMLTSASQISEANEGRLVDMQGIVFDSVGANFYGTTSIKGVKFSKDGVYRTMYVNAGGDTLRSPSIRVIGHAIPANADIVGVVYTRSDQDTTDLSKRNPYKLAPRDFNDIIEYSTVSGLVFDDVNGNGTKDVGEPGLQDWEVTADGSSTISVVSDANGNYSVNGLIAGDYTIYITGQVDWLQTLPANAGSYSLNVTGGRTLTGYDFGVFKNGMVTGIIYEDNNGNGTLDGSEFGKPGPDMYLHQGTLGNIIQTTTADEDGNFSFTDLPVGTYYVTMQISSGLKVTQPVADSTGQSYYTVTVNPPGSVSSNGNFGYFKLAKITGYKFFDLNRNGVRDVGMPGPISAEPLLKDWKVYLSSNTNVIDSQLTTQFGTFQFLNVGPGNYTVSEESRSGWIRTAPVAGTYPVSITSSGQIEGNRFFGNRVTRRGLKPHANRVSNNWSDAANWELDVLPNQEDTIDIAAGDTVFIDANALPAGYDSLKGLYVKGYVRFPTNKVLKLLNGLQVDDNGIVTVDSFISAEIRNYGSFTGTGQFIPGSSKISMLGNNAKVLGLTSSSTSFFDLKIGGANTSTASSFTVIHNVSFDNNLTVADTAHTITISNDTSSAVVGTGKISQGKMVRLILQGDTGEYRFHSQQTKLQFSGEGVPPSSVTINKDVDTSHNAYGLYRVQKTGTVDTVNNSVAVSGVTHFSRWTFGQVGYKDSSGGPVYDISSDVTLKNHSFTDPATLTLEYNPTRFSYSEDSVTLYRVATGLIVKNLQDADGNAATTNDQTAKTWGLSVRNANSDSLGSANTSQLTLSEIEADSFVVHEVDSAQWNHLGVRVNGISASGTTASLRLGVGQLGVVEFINVYQPDTTKYRTFLSSLWAEKTVALKYDKKAKHYKANPTSGNIRDLAITKTSGMVLGTPRVDSSKIYGWIVFTEGKNLLKFFPGVGTKAYPFDLIRPSKKEKLFVKALKNPVAAKYENHLATELAAYKLNVAASKTTPPAMSDADLGNLIYSDPAAARFKLNGLPIKRIADTADFYLTYYKRIPVATRDSFFNALDSAFTRINREFNSGPITSADVFPPADTIRIIPVTTKILLPQIPSFKKISNAIWFKTPAGKIEPDSPTPFAGIEPDMFKLYQNYPNPFNPSTTIQFELPDDGTVTLKVYNVIGQEVMTLLNNASLESGANEVQFNASRLSSGVYFYRLQAHTADGKSFNDVHKMVLLK